MAGFKVRFDQAQKELTLKNTTIVPTRLDGLTDVSETDSEMFDGAILIYDAANDTYRLQRMFTKDNTGQYTLNGGDF
jgi:hypothetical protein